ncbi:MULTISPECIES: phage tail protein [unclassified Roseovarius]|uniref:phage tail protein n=1 Tax=unclassified Roseovarius TaxID=2614913 RepID=UPI00273EEDBF|nr:MULTISPECIES: phage tail protein [unclassified Roseovarius]
MNSPTEMPVAFRFNVSFASPSGTVVVFQEVSGLEADLGTEPVVEGGENRFVHALPGVAKHGNLVLKRGMSEGSALLVTWCRDTLEGGFDKPIEVHDLEVSLVNDEGDAVAIWVIQQAYPVKMQAAGFDAMKNELMIETIELAYSKIHRKV